MNEINLRIEIKLYLRRLMIMSNTLAGGNVFLNHPTNYQSLPDYYGVSLESLTEQCIIASDVPRVYQRTLTLNAEIVHLPSDPDNIKNEISFEKFVSQVEEVLMADRDMQNEAVLAAESLDPIEVQDLRYEGIEYRTEPGGERPVFAAVARLEVIYNIEVGITDEGLLDLERIDSKIKRGDTGTDDTTSVDSRTILNA